MKTGHRVVSYALWWVVTLLVQRFAGKLQQSHVSGSLNSNGYSALVFSAGACLSPGANFAFPIDEILQQLGVAVM